MLGLWNLSWLNQNSQRAYPLAEHGNRASYLSSEVRIPDDLILALKLSLNTAHQVSVTRFFIKEITATGSGCAITIGYNDGQEHTTPSGYPSVGIIFGCPGTGPQIYKVSGLGDFEDIEGYIALNSACSWLNSLSGQFTFTPDATPIEPDCIVPMIQSVSSVAVSDGYSVGDRYYGDIILKAGSNIEFEVETVGDQTTITIHAVDTNGFSRQCACDTHENIPCIRSINSVYPNASGNIRLEGIGCVSIENGENTLTLRDTCATPRCDCTALQDLGTSVRDLSDGYSTLVNASNRMDVSVEQTRAIIEAELFS